jgi:hypothetical protein
MAEVKWLPQTFLERRKMGWTSQPKEACLVAKIDDNTKKELYTSIIYHNDI